MCNCTRPLTESLSKNCGKELHSELTTRVSTQALGRLFTDRVRNFVLLSLRFI